MPDKRFRIAVLISGGGTTLKNLFEKIDSGELDVDVELVISSSRNAKGLDFARERDVKTLVVPKLAGHDDDQYTSEIFSPIADAEIDLVVMGGFLKKVLIPADYENRVINIHPSLIPAFCGQGMYGMHVHEAVVQKGCRVTGCTIHFVDNEYDHGPIIEQVPIRVGPADTAADVQRKVFEQECEVYPRVIQQLAKASLS